MKALAAVRDVLIIVALLAVVFSGIVIGYAIVHRDDPRPAPAATVPPLPVDRCGGGMCQ